MARTVTLTIGPHFEEFIRDAIDGGCYNNVSGVVRAGLRLLEEEEARLSSIRSALIEGEDSGVSDNFDPATFVETLNAAYEAEVQSV